MEDNNRPWLNNYPNGVPANINVDEYSSLLALLEHCVNKFRDKPAFTCMGKTITFKELRERASRLAAYLQSRGLEPGDRVALMMPNTLQYPIALYGCLLAGLVVVNTNPLYTPREMKHQFTDSGARGIIIAENFAANLEKIIDDTDIRVVIKTSIGELLGPIKGTLVNFVVRSVKKMVPKFNLPNAITFSHAIKEGKKFSIKPSPQDPDRTISLQYTGGTTGVSKGTMLTNRNLVSNALQIRSLMVPYLEEGGEVALCPLPLYHIFAFTANCVAMMTFGAHSILVTNARDIPSVVKEFKNNKVSMVTGVNTLFNALLNNEKFRKLDFSSLKVTVGGGMAVQKSVAEEWLKVTGCYLNEGYGMTESSPLASVNPLDGSGKLGSIGLPAPSTLMRIVDEEGNPLPPNEVGEIQIKGPQVMKGYYNRPDETAKALVEGWLNTGDIGLMMPDGYFKIIDRKKDMINVSGFNVYPNEIEDVIASHPKVLEVAAVGVPNEKSGECVKLFVVKKDKSLTDKELIAFSKENLTGYKVPKEIEFRKELPKTNVGKILRRALREEEG
ncbi:MAG: long-chain-fatty-acid--CoA ligase [Saprospirales bacterium]|nr:MAG: long-chain-fatty-acid--CoA ligase [Saprospirales bacterium]